MTLKTYAGGCHCGDVRYEVDLDLAAGTAKCNCSICKKTRNWAANVKPAAFRLLTSPDKLSDYQFGTLSGHHRFCSRCGIRSFGDGHVEQVGGDYVSIAIACLDAPDEEIAAAPVHFSNGRDNDWMHPPKVTSYL